jgi:hypothetical protein
VFQRSELPATPPLPEAAAAALREGDRLWVVVDEAGSSLGSGVPIRLVELPEDGIHGWRLATVVDPESLLFSVDSVESASLAPGLTVAPLEVWRSDPDPLPARVGPFPVGSRRTADLLGGLVGWALAGVLLMVVLVLIGIAFTGCAR